ncbi:MAG: adenylyltransferase/cytidyltransferase family protein [Parahaliea sp.]
MALSARSITIDLARYFKCPYYGDGVVLAKVIITFGTFDVFHVGHLRVLERAAVLGTKLVVGVSTDALNVHKKGRNPVYCQNQRMEIICALRCVSEAFFEESLELKRHYLTEYKADILVMGNDWKGRFDEFSDICDVIYLPRTPAISTTQVIEKVRS